MTGGTPGSPAGVAGGPGGAAAPPPWPFRYSHRAWAKLAALGPELLGPGPPPHGGCAQPSTLRAAHNTTNDFICMARSEQQQGQGRYGNT